jgi:hypothetical protein
MRHRFTAGLLTATLGAGLLAAGVSQANASSKGRKNTALGLGAAAAYGLLSGKTGTGIIAGAGAAYAYKKYKDSRDEERRYDRYDRSSRSRSRYRTNSTGGDFQFPSEYGGNGGQSQYDGGQYQRGDYNDQRQYSRRENHRRAGSRSNDSRRYRTRYNRDDDDNRRRPRGWSRGNKTGWNGRSVPPGQSQKQHQWD